MQYLLDELSSRYKFEHYSTENDLWIDLEASQNRNIRESFIKIINEKRKENIRMNLNPRIIVDGHFWQTEFNYDEIHHKFEYIQLIRECHSRRRSSFYYFLIDSAAAQLAKKTNTSIAFLKHALNTSDPERCLNDMECLKNAGSGRFSRTPMELRYICGSKCNTGYNEPYKSLLRLRDPSKLTVLGVLDNMTAYLEMLECAYPSFLRNITAVYNGMREVCRVLVYHA
jgi:hypothetical protein